MRERLENPVFRQSSRQRMRGARTYGCLLAYLLVLGLVVIISYDQFIAHGLQRTTTGLAQMLFETLAMTQWFLVAFITPALTTSAITMEREQRTYDLLMMTPLSRFAIVWGKFASAVAFIVVMILCGMPLVAVLFLMGGVDVGLMFTLYLGMLATGAVLASYGLMMSAICATSTLANLLTYGSLAVGYVVGAVAGAAFTFSRAFGGGSFSMLWLGSGLTPWQVWTFSVLTLLLTVWLYLQIASNYLFVDPRTGAWKTRALLTALHLLILVATLLDAQATTRASASANYLGGVFAFMWVPVIPALFTGVPYEGKKWHEWLRPGSLRVGTVQSALPFMCLIVLSAIVADRFMPALLRTQPLVWVYVMGYFCWIWSLGYLLSFAIRNRWGALFALIVALAVLVQLVYTVSVADFGRGRLRWFESLVNIALPVAPWETSGKMDYRVWVVLYPLMASASLLLTGWLRKVRRGAAAEG